MKTMKYALAIALSLIAIAAPKAARADSIVLLDVRGMFTGGTSLTGSVTIDATTGSVTAVDLTTTGNVTGTYTDIDLQAVTGVSPNSYFYFETDDSDGAYLFLTFDQASLTGYSAGSLCSTGATCPFAGGDAMSQLYDNTAIPGTEFGLLSSCVTDPLPTPEPSSLILVGAGLLSLVGIALGRKRSLA